jgi:predicted nucleic acid-binding protein
VGITSAVRAEVLPRRNAPGERQIRRALRRGILYEIPEVDASNEVPRLGRGETATIAAALNFTTHGQSCLILMDDRKARNRTERLALQSIRVIGTGAIVALAKERGLIESASQAFDQLRETGFYASREIIASFLKQLGEETASLQTPSKIPRVVKHRKKRR